MSPDELTNLIKETTLAMNDLHKHLSNIYSLRYKALIHGIVKRGLMKWTDLELISGMSETNLRKMVEEMDLMMEQKK